MLEHACRQLYNGVGRVLHVSLILFTLSYLKSHFLELNTYYYVIHLLCQLPNLSI